MNPLNIAHRGNSCSAPENTLAAFASAAAAGAAMIETDLQLCADGSIVLIHDSTLDRTAGRHGRVAELASAELRSADAGSWFSSEFAGERIPGLEDLAKFAADEPELRWLLEFKGEWTPDQAGTAAQILRDAGIAGRCVLQSFSRNTVQSLHEAAPDIGRGLLVTGPPENGREALLLEFLAETESSYCNPHGGVLQGSPSLVPMLQGAGVKVLAWTLNEPWQWEEAANAGVDGIITDRPAELAVWAGPAA